MITRTTEFTTYVVRRALYGAKAALLCSLLTISADLQAQQQKTVVGLQLNTTLNAWHTFWKDASALSFVDIQARGYVLQETTKWTIICVLWISPSQQQVSVITAREQGMHTPYLFWGIKTSWAVSYGIGYQRKKEKWPFWLFTELWMFWTTPFFIQGVWIPLSLATNKK